MKVIDIVRKDVVEGIVNEVLWEVLRSREEIDKCNNEIQERIEAACEGCYDTDIL